MMPDPSPVNRHTAITDQDAAMAHAARATDALAAMMGAEGQRIDGLYKDVGEIKGDVRSVKSEVSSVSTGINELRKAMAALVTLDVQMAHQAESGVSLRRELDLHDQRLQTIERKAPGWDEMRTFIMRAAIAVLSVVGMALLALVVKAGANV
jgi:seryl-tRNA synthetase